MKEKEYLRLKAKLEADYRRQLEALDTVFRMDGGNPTALAKQLNGKTERTSRTSRGDLSDAIDAILPTYGSSDLTAADMYVAIQNKYPALEPRASSVSSALVRLAKGDNSPLVVVAQGSGRRATIFRNRHPKKMERVS